MSVPATDETRYEAVREALRREIAAARTRLTELAKRRKEAEASLRAARAAEDAARANLNALEGIGRKAGANIADPSESDGQQAHEEGLRRLAGVELREMIARIALQHRAMGQPVHWRTWHEWLRNGGFEAAGKDPAATFLTQLSRSALVARSTQDGVYILDLTRFVRTRDHVHALHQQLLRLPPPDQLALLGDVRAQRRTLQVEITRGERALEEMWRVLTQERPPVWPKDVELVPDLTMAAWLENREASDDG